MRIALNVKNLNYEYIAVNLVKNEQGVEDYMKKNPMGLVPSLEITDGVYLHQSMAILEYLEEMYPDVPLLPKDSVSRCIIRSMCMIIVADTQPLQNLKILNRVGETKMEWGHKIIVDGLTAFERVACKYTKGYSFGDSITLADICLVPQVYNAIRFKVDMTQFPTIRKIMDKLKDLNEVEMAHPKHMPDAVQE